MAIPSVKELSAFHHLVVHANVRATLLHTGFSLFKLRTIVSELEAFVGQPVAEWGVASINITPAGERMGAGLGAALRLVEEGLFKTDAPARNEQLAEAARQVVLQRDRFAYMQRDYLTDGQSEGPVRIPLLRLISEGREQAG
jgi:hypothetical protein